MKESVSKLVAGLTLAVVFVGAPSAIAQARESFSNDPDQPIVSRRTIPDPQAVRRAPLTSARLSSTSTRLIDARRGLRPYDSVFGGGTGASRDVLVGFDDNFGISRPEDRPYSRSLRRPATGVTTFTAARRPQTRAQISTPSVPLVVVVRDERRDARADRPAPDMTVRVHRDKPELPTRSGAVIIGPDGTVYQVGD